MAYQPFLISDFKTGVNTELAPWMLPKDAFQYLYNGYIHHGVIFKRNGMQFYGQMTHWEASITAITAANPGQVTVAAVAGLANDQTIQISYATGGTFSSLNGGFFLVKNLAGATFDLYDTDGNPYDTSGLGVYGGGGVVSIVASAAGAISPGLPVMGIKNFVSSSTQLYTLLFDTRRAAVYNETTRKFDPLDVANIFTGDKSNFISAAGYGRTGDFNNPRFFFSNYNGDSSGALDNMRYFDPTAPTQTTAFVPVISTAAADIVVTAQFIHTIKQRLVILNTYETRAAASRAYPQRARWCKAGDPSVQTGAVYNWNDVTPGLGGYVDAPTSEAIVSSIQLQDRLIVFFTSSVWTLEPTSDSALPFRWKRLNSIRASDAPYGAIGHDRYASSLGRRGIFATDGIETIRIDDKIQNFVGEEINLDNIRQVFSARNYQDRRSWTLYPSSVVATSGDESTTSNRALIRTDEEGSWCIYSTQVVDSAGAPQNMSCLGYGQLAIDLAYSDFNGVIEEDKSYGDFGDETYNSFFNQDESELFLGGDQTGRVFILEEDGDDNGKAIDFSLTSAGWNPYKDEGKEAQMGYVDFYIDSDPNVVYTINFYVNDRFSPYATQSFNALPEIGFISEIQGITQANPAVITSYDHGLATGDQVYIYAVLGMIDVNGGPYTITVIDLNSFSLDGIDSSGYAAYTSGGWVTWNRLTSQRCWKRVYAGGTGYEHFITVDTSGIDQIVGMHAFVPWFRPIGNRMVQ